VYNPDGEMLTSGAIHDLQQAPRIAGSDDPGPGAFDMPDFALKELVGHLRLNQVVDARAATAPGAFRKLDQLEIWNRVQQLARLRSNLLAMAKMAGFMISDRCRRLITRRAWFDADLHEPFVNIFDFRIPELRAVVISRIIF